MNIICDILICLSMITGYKVKCRINFVNIIDKPCGGYS